MSAKHRLAMWVRWLAVTAAHPERAFTAVTVGRARRGAPRNADVTIARLPVLGSDPAFRREAARRRLAVIVDLYDRGMREPLPMACLTSAAYAEAAAAGEDAEAAGRAAWETDRFDLEDREPEHQLVLGGVRPFRDLLREPPMSGETGEGWDGGETSRFGRYARRLWADVLAHEEVSDR